MTQRARMAQMVVEVFDDEAALARAAASAIAARLRAEPRSVLGLPTGRTMQPVYACLAADPACAADWSAVRTFNLDEFVGLPAAHAASYRTFMRRHLFGAVGIPPAQAQFPDGAAADLEAECRRYDEAIRAAGGIDLQVLGIGANGHVGFNEPGESLTAATHRVALHESTRRANAAWFGGDVARVPSEALSVGMAAILTARAVLLVAAGEGKAAAVAAMIDGPVTTRVPASFLQLHRSVVVMADRAAAAALRARRSTDGASAAPRAAP